MNILRKLILFGWMAIACTAFGKDRNADKVERPNTKKVNFGIKAGASAVNATITNNNDIKLTGSSSYSSTQQKGYGISIVDGTAENKGSITFDGMYGWGMYTTTGTVKNSTGSIIMNAGGTGLYGNGSGAQMINSQRIAINVPDNDDKAETYGIYADGGASASNTANAEIYIKSSSVTANMLAKAFGIYVNQGSGTNQGTIKIEGSNTVGMAYAGSTDTDAIINLESGLINLTGNNHIGMTAALPPTAAQSMSASKPMTEQSRRPPTLSACRRPAALFSIREQSMSTPPIR